MKFLADWIRDKFAVAMQIIDGPTAITNSRNILVQPKLKNRNKFSNIDWKIKYEY